MSTLSSQYIDVFRAGDYGNKGKYTVPMLAAMAASYDPAKHEVPHVVGHPKMDGPAFAWTKAMRLEGDVLQVLPGEVDPAFEAAVKAGRFKKRSVAFTTNEDGTLRVPLELRHIGWLGAMPPAVKGLGDAQFGAERFQEVEFSDEVNPGDDMNEEQVQTTVKDTLKAFFADIFGGQKPDAGTITQAQVDAAAKKAADAVEKRFADQLEAERVERKRVETEFGDFKKSAGATSATVQAATLIAGLKERKHWIPAFDKMGVPALFAALTSGTVPATIEFSDGAAQVKKDPAQLFADILDGIGQIVPEGVTFASGKLEIAKPAPNGNGASVDPGSIAFNDAVATRAAEKSITFGEAYKQLTAEGKSAASFGGASAGAV